MRLEIITAKQKGDTPAKHRCDTLDLKVSDKIGKREMLTVLPFIMKGKIFGKHKGFPFFETDGVTPIGNKRP